MCLEAMGHGVPCVFSDLAVHREISDNGMAAMLFRTGDANDLREKLYTLSLDESKRKTLGTAARNLVSARYSAQTAQRRYVQAFELQSSPVLNVIE